MIKSADIQQLGVGLGSLYLQLNFLREQNTTDLLIIVVWFISNDNKNVIYDTNGPKEKICYY